jgi:hypothetical protein
MATKDAHVKWSSASRQTKNLVLKSKLSTIVSKYECILDSAPLQLQSDIYKRANDLIPEVIELLEFALNVYIKKVDGWSIANKEEEMAVNKFCMVAAVEIIISSPMEMRTLMKSIAEEEPEMMYGLNEFLKHNMKPGATNLVVFSDIYYGDYEKDAVRLDTATAIVGWRRKVLIALGEDEVGVEHILIKLLKGSKELEVISEENQPKTIYGMLSVVRKAEKERAMILHLRGDEGEAPRLAVN